MAEKHEVPDAQLTALTHCACGSRLRETSAEVPVTNLAGETFSAMVPAKECTCGEVYLMAEAMRALRD